MARKFGDTQWLVTTDERGRASLKGIPNLATHYRVHEETDGTLILTPAKLVKDTR